MSSVAVTVTVAWFVVAACGSRPTEPDWLIVPEQRAGAVQSTSTETQLIDAYGAAAVQRSRIELGEGETAPGTVLFPADSLSRLEVLWQDTVAFGRPSRLILRGHRSRWQLPSAVSLGTSLVDLERVNGKAFTLAGFGWDYGGVVLDWQSGSLASALPGVRLYLDPDPAQYHTPAYNQVLGDHDYRSSLPALHQLNPRVHQIYVDFK